MLLITAILSHLKRPILLSTINTPLGVLRSTTSLPLMAAQAAPMFPRGSLLLLSRQLRKAFQELLCPTNSAPSRRSMHPHGAHQQP